MMDLQKLFEIQAGLDKHINKEKGLEGQDLLPKKILALQVELGELANEWQMFKFWKVNPKPRYKKAIVDKYGNKKYINPLLEEYVDCLHFILSIGNEIDFTSYGLIGNYQRPENITEMFSLVFVEIGSLFNGLQNKSNDVSIKIFYSVLLDSLLELGEMLGFTWEQIEQAYLEKNKINHQRQQNGY